MASLMKHDASTNSLADKEDGEDWNPDEDEPYEPTAGFVELDKVTPEQVEEIRSRIDPFLALKGLDEAMMARFIKATGGNMDLAVKRLEATLRWRLEVKPDKVVCQACAKDPRSHYMHVVGHDLQGRPIIYSCFEMTNNRDIDATRDHIISVLEMAVKTMPKGVEQWIWVCDFHGFGVPDANPKVAKLFLEISAEHYPERLGQFIIVDAPKLFGVLWKAVRKLVDPKTYRKIRFVPWDIKKKGADSKLAAELAQHCDAVTAGWLLKEMYDNRDKKKGKDKAYNPVTLYEGACDGVLCDPKHLKCGHGKAQGTAAQVAAVFTEMKPQPHNCSGTPALLHLLNENPDLLLPQGNP